MISASQLVNLKLKALRKKAWFTVLDREERIVVDLVIRCVKKVRSLLLVRILKCVMNKLEDALKSETVRFVISAGPCLARKIAEIAISWGNMQAKDWASDVKFARYLAITKLNIPEFFSL
jgi:hypothetical protein